MTADAGQYLLELYGGDPFGQVFDACEAHREEHGPECGVYPSNQAGMRVVAVLVRATGARRILEIGTGIGYSGLHLAAALGPDGHLDTIEAVPAHAALARQNFDAAGLGDPVRIIEGGAASVLPTLTGPYDFVYDDGWFARQPPYLDALIDLLRPNGLVVMPNWFLLDDAISGEPRMNWAAFAGERWEDETKAYARTLAAHPRLYVAFDLPLLAVGVRLA